MKGRKDIGEYKIWKKLAPNYEIHQFGRKEFINLRKPDPIDYILARRALEFAKKALKRKPRLLILDEINLAVSIGLIGLDEVLELLREIPKPTTVVLTGRNAPRELIERADLVTEMKMVKHYYASQGLDARFGIEF